MRSSSLVAVSCLFALYGCDSDAERALAITPAGANGTVAITAPTVFTAELKNLSGEVAWTASAGSLSSDKGLHVTYAPPPGAATATLTAKVGDVTASVQVASSPLVLDGKKIAGLSAEVTVQYDAQDVPHIKCAQLKDCIAVQGYVHAHDRLFPMDFLRHVARSTLSELIGAAGLSQDQTLRTLFITRDGKPLAEALTAAMDPAVKDVVQAYASGVNAYLNELRQTNAPLTGEYAQLPFPLTGSDIPDWTVADTVAMARLQQFQLSESLTEETNNGKFAAVYGPTGTKPDAYKLNAWIRSAAPATERAHTLETTPFTPPSIGAVKLGQNAPRHKLGPWNGVLAALETKATELKHHLRPADASVGSNNWVIGPKASATGKAMLANDPHLTLQYPPLFHLSAMTSSNPDDHLDLTGGAFPGIPGALVGRGQHVAWGVTVVGYDVTDLYLEQFLPQGSCATAAPCVQYKGAPVSTIPVPQTYKVRVAAGSAAGSFSPVSGTVLVVPHHGPIVQAPDANGKSVSARWTGHEANTQDVRAILGLGTAVDVAAAINALKDFSTGAQNYVLADDQGHIAYDPHALVPKRNFADIRVVDANVIPPWFPLPGTTGTAEWGDGVADCAAPAGVPAACWIADEELPHAFAEPDKGYFFTANADPLGVTDDNNPLAHPPYFSFTWDDSSGFRATRIEQLIEAARKRGGVTLEDMIAIQSDHVSRPGAAFAPYIAAAPGTSAELTLAKDVIAKWAAAGFDCPTGLLGTDPVRSAADPDATVVTNSQGCYLFHQFLRNLVINVFTDELKVAGQTPNGLHAVKSLLFMLGSSNEADAVLCNDYDPAQEPVKHTCLAQVSTALAQAIKTLGADPSKWAPWGRVHTARPVPPVALVTTYFEPGPYARPGGSFTVDVASPSLTGSGDFAYTSGANVRHISVLDPAKPLIKMQLPGPERDVPTVNGGPDLLGQWVTNTYFDFAFGSQSDQAAVSSQSFKAP